MHKHPHLRDQMFRDRAAQFRDRLGWEVSVDADGFERDEYDDLNPLYVISVDANGNHQGSMRFLPTTGQNMINDHFVHLLDNQPLSSPFIWECTRFCLAPTATSSAAASLMLAGGELLDNFDINHFAGVFDASMIRIYKAIGAAPEILGSDGPLHVGLWSFTKDSQAKVARRAKVTVEQSKAWFDQSFNADQETGEIPVNAT